MGGERGGEGREGRECGATSEVRAEVSLQRRGGREGLEVDRRSGESRLITVDVGWGRIWLLRGRGRGGIGSGVGVVEEQHDGVVTLCLPSSCHLLMRILRHCCCLGSSLSASLSDETTVMLVRLDLRVRDVLTPALNFRLDSEKVDHFRLLPFDPLLHDDGVCDVSPTQLDGETVRVFLDATTLNERLDNNGLLSLSTLEIALLLTVAEDGFLRHPPLSLLDLERVLLQCGAMRVERGVLECSAAGSRVVV